MLLRLRKRRIVLLTASALCMGFVFALDSSAQTPTPSPSPAPCSPIAPCPKLAPRVIQLSVIYKKGDQPLEQTDKVTQLARKRFYLSSCPFNLDKLQTMGHAPTRAAYYTNIKASPQLIKWLADNNCDTIYCRELTREEVACKTTDAQCIPEFARAYNEALKKLKGDAELARKWVTNYEPLSSPGLGVGYYNEKMRWLDFAVKAAEASAGLAAGTIRMTMTDRRGVAYFYDLCPGTYYISNLAPIEIEGESIVWETSAITIKAPKAGEQDQLTVTPVFLANVPSKKKRANFFVGRKAAGAATPTIRAAYGESPAQ